MALSDAFPRQYARTRGFNLGLPRSFQVADDGSRVAFLRTPAGDDPHAALWVYDVADDREREVYRSRSAEERLTQAEIDRRERARERQAGVVTVRGRPGPAGRRRSSWGPAAGGRAGRRATSRALVTRRSGVRPTTRSDRASASPTSTDGALHVLDLDDGTDRRLADDDDPDVHWGLAEFIAAEEMERLRGYWWAPDGERLLACRVDERPVATWHIASPMDPAAAAAGHPLSAGGAPTTRSSRCTWWAWTAHSSTSTGTARRSSTSSPCRGLRKDRRWPWCNRATSEPCRCWRSIRTPGRTEVVWRDHDERWTHIVDGRAGVAPRRPPAHGGPPRRHPQPADRRRTRDARRGCRSMRCSTRVTSWCSAPPRSPPRCTCGAWRPDGSLERLTRRRRGRTAPSVGGDLIGARRRERSTRPCRRRPLCAAETAPHLRTARRNAELRARPTFASLGPKELRSALFTPGEPPKPDEPLPVLLDPYGGPHFGRVQRMQRMHLESQWFADQGFAVLVIDGRGTPYRGVAWDQAVYRDYIDVGARRTRSRASTPRPSAIRSSIWAAWRCAAGPTADT